MVANPLRYYRLGPVSDSLKELGGFAATLKLESMMKQSKPAGRQLSLRRFVSVRVLALLLAPCIAAPWLAGVARAEGHPVHARAKTVARQTELAPPDRSKGLDRERKSGGSKSGGRNGGKIYGSNGSSKSARDTAKPEPGKSGPHAKAGRHKRSVEDESEPVTMHRTAWRGAKAIPRGRAVSVRPVPARSKKVASSKGADVPPATLTDAARPLTVDDFMRAAAPDTSTIAPNGRVYVRGESRTEEDDRIDGQAPVAAIKLPPRPILALKPTATRRPVVTASVQARTALDSPAPMDGGGLVATAPSDLVGAPVHAADNDIGPTPTADPAMRTRGLPGPLPTPTRQEMIEEVEQPVVLPGLYRNGRLVVPSPLKGTHEILVHQNLMADDEGLGRIQDDSDLNRLRAAHLLVNFPESASLHINPELAANRRCARVWTVKFAADIARDYYARFRQPLQVNSAVRTVAYQVRLQRTNGNAAGIDGETASPHLTGQALDFGKRDMNVAQIAWMRSYLLPLMRAGKLDVEEEFQQACFHISVYRSYLPIQRRGLRTEVAQLKEPRVKSVTRGDEIR